MPSIRCLEGPDCKPFVLAFVVRVGFVALAGILDWLLNDYDTSSSLTNFSCDKEELPLFRQPGQVNTALVWGTEKASLLYPICTFFALIVS
jgi:hypothetical protein